MMLNVEVKDCRPTICCCKTQNFDFVEQFLEVDAFVKWFITSKWKRKGRIKGEEHAKREETSSQRSH